MKAIHYDLIHGRTPMTKTNASPQDLTLLTGGTGKTGRRVAERLRALGVPTRIGSRSAELPFDWNDHSTWIPALNGVSSVYIVYYPDLAVPGAAETIQAFVDRAVESGPENWFYCRGAERRKPGAAKRSYRTPASTGRCFGPPGSVKISVRASCGTSSSAGPSPFRPATYASRSST
jgi:hypothetical protein